MVLAWHPLEPLCHSWAGARSESGLTGNQFKVRLGQVAVLVPKRCAETWPTGNARKRFISPCPTITYPGLFTVDLGQRHAQ